jgi:hypothetical protein
MIAVLLSVLLLTSDVPPGTAEADTTTSETAKPKKEKKICRTKLIDTGSRMRKTECRTQAQWDSRDSQNIDDMKSLGGR